MKKHGNMSVQERTLSSSTRVGLVGLKDVWVTINVNIVNKQRVKGY